MVSGRSPSFPKTILSGELLLRWRSHESPNCPRHAASTGIKSNGLPLLFETEGHIESRKSARAASKAGCAFTETDPAVSFKDGERKTAFFNSQPSQDPGCCLPTWESRRARQRLARSLWRAQKTAPAPVHLHPSTCDGRRATAVPQSRLTGPPDPGQKTTPAKPGELFCRLVSGFRGTDRGNQPLASHSC